MSSRTAVRVLVTGFGPFPGVPYNASAALVTALALSPPAPGIELFAEIIPVIWADARQAAREAIARARPDAVLHFGVSKRARGFEIETRAFNLSGPKKDHAGLARPARQLERAGTPVLFATLPPAILLRVLRRNGYPAQLSRSVGRYLCNAIFYWSLLERWPNAPLTGFIHMPALGLEESVRPCLNLTSAVEGAHVLVRASAQAVRSARWPARQSPLKNAPPRYCERSEAILGQVFDFILDRHGG
jgi:pyroglutamyl-peptidase